MPKKEMTSTSNNEENNLYVHIEHLVEDWLPDSLKKLFRKYFTLPVLGGFCCGLLSFSVSYAILPSLFVGLVGGISTHVTFLILTEVAGIMLRAYENLQQISNTIEHIEKTADKLNRTVFNEENLKKLNKAIDNFTQCSEEAKQGLVEARSILSDVQAVSNPAGNVVRAATHQTQRVKNAVSGGVQAASNVCKKIGSAVAYPFSSQQVPVEANNEPSKPSEEENQPVEGSWLKPWTWRGNSNKVKNSDPDRDKKFEDEMPSELEKGLNPPITYARYKQESEKLLERHHHSQREKILPDDSQSGGDSDSENDAPTLTRSQFTG